MSDRRKLPGLEVPGDAFDKLAEYAKQKDKSVSQAIREALQEYLWNNAEVKADFSVGVWGGWRGGSKDESED